MKFNLFDQFFITEKHRNLFELLSYKVSKF